MATKTITGSYSGYELENAYNALIIAKSAIVDGTGVVSYQSIPNTITNLGLVDCDVGTYRGVYLLNGGTIVNGSTSNTSAEIAATTPIYLAGTYSTVKNYATIVTDSFGDGSGPSVTMEAGGTVGNFGSAADISNGISISGGPGRVTNTGSIGSPTYKKQDGAYVTSASIAMSDGGTVVNGSSSVTSATIGNGIHISGGLGSVTNAGSIGSPSYTLGTKDTGSASITMSDGGGVVNGSNSNTAAAIYNGVSISGGAGSLTNFGTVGGPRTYNSDSEYTRRYASVSFQSGGSVVNGSAKDTTASLGDGVSVSGGTGSVTNFGKIGAPSYYYMTPGGYELTRQTAAIDLQSGGTVVNEASGLINGVSVESGSGTIHNYGGIEGPYYSAGPSRVKSFAAVSLADGGTIINEAGGTIAGISITGGSTQINNDGSIGAPSYSNYGSVTTYISIDMAGVGTVTNGSATDKAASISAGVSLHDGASTLTNFGTIGAADTAGVGVMLGEADETLVEEGTGTLDGTVTGTGSTLLLAGDAGAGTIGGFGSTITGFALIDVVAGATWTITGAVTVAASEEFAVDGTATFTGAITNDGDFRDKGSAVLGSNASFTNEADGTVTFAASGASFTGTIMSSGQILVEGPLTLRQSSVLDIANGGTLTLQGAASIAGGALSIASGGTFAKTLAGTAIVRSNTTDTGTITISTGTLQFSAASTDIAGAVSGKGNLAFGRGTATLEDGTTIKTSALTVGGNGADLDFDTSIYFAKQFTATAGAVLTFDSGISLTTAGSASFASTMFAGAGHLTTKGSVTASLMTFGGTSYWLNYAAVTETGTTKLGAGTSLTNAAGATFSLAGNVGIAETGGAKISNAGSLIKTAGSGTSTIAGAVVNTGSIEAKTGILDVTGAVTGTGGTLLVDAGVTLELDAAVAAGQTASFSSASGTLKLGDAQDFAATIAKFNAGDSLDVSGFATPGTTFTFVENGAGTLGLLQLTDGSTSATLSLSGNHAASSFHLKSDGHGGTIVSYGAGGVAMATSPREIAAPAPVDRHVADLGNALFEGTFAPSAGWSGVAPRPRDDHAFAFGASHEEHTQLATLAHR